MNYWDKGVNESVKVHQSLAQSERIYFTPCWCGQVLHFDLLLVLEEKLRDQINH